MIIKKYWHGKEYEYERLSRDLVDVRFVKTPGGCVDVSNGETTVGQRPGLISVGEILKTYRFPFERQ